MNVTIPFQEDFKDPMLEGRKNYTSRTKKYGKPGDTFTCFGTTFTIEGVVKAPLWYVAQYLYQGEGFATREDFIKCWERLHPRKGYVPDQQVWVHFFLKKRGET